MLHDTIGRLIKQKLLTTHLREFAISIFSEGEWVHDAPPGPPVKIGDDVRKEEGRGPIIVSSLEPQIA